ncbi:hypothetical protein PoB_004990900 [Plakobranchus ocellatus]|uniref:Uncharacterized protein n=1 Tax=Plakobranchus ocellatus TaxID=259542 RepID=A0AAV4BT87_9GAST|nr:hypothetical protein PoB_004990900 [Plakobranchus ocellatus]
MWFLSNFTANTSRHAPRYDNQGFNFPSQPEERPQTKGAWDCLTTWKCLTKARWDFRHSFSFIKQGSRHVSVLYRVIMQKVTSAPRSLQGRKREHRVKEQKERLSKLKEFQAIAGGSEVGLSPFSVQVEASSEL